MTAVVRKTTLEPIFTNNTGKYNPIYYWIDPDLSAVSDYPYKHWQETDGVFSLLSKTQRDDVDAAEIIALDIREKSEEKVRFSKDRILVALVKMILDEFNILRSAHGLEPRTLAQLRVALENKIDGS